MQLRAFDERVGRASWAGFCWGAAAGSIIGLWATDLVPESPRFVVSAAAAFDLVVAYSGVCLAKLSVIAVCAWGAACAVGLWARFVAPDSRVFDS